MEKKRNSTTKMRLTCAIIFIVFTYLILSCYQQDLLAVAQHALSGGMNPVQLCTVSHPALPLSCFFFKCSVFAITRVKKRFHALTYFPSLLILAIITDIPTDIDTYHSLGSWCWLFRCS